MASRAKAVKVHQLKLFLSNKYTYAQVIRTTDGHVLAAASTIEKGLQEGLLSKSDKAACSRVGQAIAQRAQQAGIDAVQWQRKRGQKYHGKIAALIEGLKSAGVSLE